MQHVIIKGAFIVSPMVLYHRHLNLNSQFFKVLRTIGCIGRNFGANGIKQANQHFYDVAVNNTANL